MSAMLGKFSNGKFVKTGEKATLRGNVAGFREQNIEFQRKEFAADLIQPDDGTGKLNPDYVALYYDKAIEHGLIAAPNPDVDDQI